MTDTLNSEQVEILERVLESLLQCEQYFRLRDRTNAKIHLASPKYSPITKAVSNSCGELENFLQKYGRFWRTNTDGLENENGSDQPAGAVLGE